MEKKQRRKETVLFFLPLCRTTCFNMEKVEYIKLDLKESYKYDGLVYCSHAENIGAKPFDGKRKNLHSASFPGERVSPFFSLFSLFTTRK